MMKWMTTHGAEKEAPGSGPSQRWSALPRCVDRRMRDLKRLPDRTPVPAGAMPRQPRWPTAAARRRARRLRRRAAGTTNRECEWSGCQSRNATGDVGGSPITSMSAARSRSAFAPSNV
jgi:hypothetical protein